MANTPFLDLVKPAGTDRALVSVINSNSDKIDGGVSTLSEQIAPYGESQWVGNVTSIDALNSLITPGRYLRYLNIANVGLPGGWAVVDVSALKGYDNYIQVVTYPTTGESYTRHHPTNGSWTNFASLKSNVTPETISTGITGVVAYKVGRMVFMRFYDFKVASGFSAQLPDSLKPATNMYIVLAGATGTYAGMFTISTTGNAAFNTSDYSKYYYGSGAYVSAT